MESFTSLHYMFQEEKKDTIAEEFEKYKRILEREDEEFKEVMKPEVSTSLLSYSSKMKDTTPEKHVLLPVYIKICSIFF